MAAPIKHAAKPLPIKTNMSTLLKRISAADFSTMLVILGSHYWPRCSYMTVKLRLLVKRDHSADPQRKIVSCPNVATRAIFVSESVRKMECTS
jgi:hypothetical protein